MGTHTIHKSFPPPFLSAHYGQISVFFGRNCSLKNKVNARDTLSQQKCQSILFFLSGGFSTSAKGVWAFCPSKPAITPPPLSAREITCGAPLLAHPPGASLISLKFSAGSTPVYCEEEEFPLFWRSSSPARSTRRITSARLISRLPATASRRLSSSSSRVMPSRWGNSTALVHFLCFFIFRAITVSWMT